jgi:hypothetical protein
VKTYVSSLLQSSGRCSWWSSPDPPRIYTQRFTLECQDALCRIGTRRRSSLVLKISSIRWVSCFLLTSRLITGLRFSFTPGQQFCASHLRRVPFAAVAYGHRRVVELAEEPIVRCLKYCFVLNHRTQGCSRKARSRDQPDSIKHK